MLECETSLLWGSYRTMRFRNQCIVACNAAVLRVVLLGALACTASTALASPITSEDYMSTPFYTAVVIDVLANDDANGGLIDPSSIEITTPAGNGDIQVDEETGLVIYTPDPNFDGEDSFEYRVSNTSSQVSNTAAVYVVVDANQLPVIDSVECTYNSAALEWTITGIVDDEVPTWLDLEVDGDVTLSCAVDNEGKFEFTVSGGPSQDFDLALEVVDEVSEHVSEIYNVWLYPY